MEESVNESSKIKVPEEWKTPEKLLEARLKRAGESIKKRGWYEDGLIANFIKLTARYTDAPFEQSEALAFILAGHILGPSAWFNMQPPPRMNFFIVLVSPSAVSRWSTTSDVLREILPVPMIYEGTPEGITDELKDLTKVTERRNGLDDEEWQKLVDGIEKKYEVVESSKRHITYYKRDKVAEATLIIDEFQRFMAKMVQESGPHSHEDAFFNKLYDGRSISTCTRTGGRRGTEKHFVSLLAITTEATFRATLKPQLIDSRFLGRLLIITIAEWKGEPRVKKREDIKKLSEKLKERVHELKSKSFSFYFDWDTYVKYFVILNDYIQEKKLEEFARAEEHLLKIAAVHSFDRYFARCQAAKTSRCQDVSNIELKIEEEDFKMAFNYITSLLDDMKALLPVHRSDVRSKLMKILKAYRDVGKITHRNLLRRAGIKDEVAEPYLMEFEKMGWIERKDEKTESGQTTKVIYIKKLS